ncbi:AbiH family protein [Mycoplasma todarodis]|uniref:AbiH family protein n=1 Tax=Mycoplasma todarodis TaxID=1937191 RepID=UPI003B38ED91
MLNKYKNTLYIIGNGYDLQEGLQTKFTDFKEWLITNKNQDSLKKIEKSFGLKDENDWNHLEDKMFLSKGIFEEMVNQFKDNASYNISGEWEEEYHIEHEISLAVDEDIRDNFIFSEALNDLVKSWIKNALENSNQKHLILDSSNSLINFNYTNYVKGNILHIHGNIKGDIQFGHSDDSKNDRPRGLYGNDDHSGEFWQKLYCKQIKSNLLKLNKFLSTNKYNQIVFFGFSLGSQDQGYIKELDKNQSILFYFLTDLDKERATDFFDKNNFKSVKYIKSVLF